MRCIFWHKNVKTGRKKTPEVYRKCHSVGTSGTNCLEQGALFDELPVDVEFSKCNATGTTDVVAPSADVIKAAVFYADVADVTVAIQADDEYAKFTFFASDIFRCTLRTMG